LVDCEHGVDYVWGESFGETGFELGGEGGAGDREKEFTIDFAGEFEVIKEL
jgi:hypothetical protein